MTLTADQEGFGTGDRRIRWSELAAVGLHTTADGPFVEDVFWQFLLPGGVVELPGSMIDNATLAAMQEALPGFDSMKLVSAMGSTSERTFRLWHGEASSWQWDDAVFGARFTRLVERLGGRPSGALDVFGRLRAAWSGVSRRYHDLEHLMDCLRELDGAAEPAVADIAELALWYHDAVYEPRARDAEARSAALLEEDAASLGLSREAALAAAACVRATAHLAGARPSGPAAELVVDVDLSILGCDPLRFLEYEYGVAEEHAAVPSTAYVLARGHFLAGLLASPSIFRTEPFRQRYEASARRNLAALLRSPRYRAHRWVGRVYALFA